MNSVSRPQAGRNRDSFSQLMEIFLEPNDDGEAQLQAGPDRDSPPPRNSRVVHHSARHVLTSCPLTATLREEIFQGDTLHTLFHTVKGAIKLATFLLRSNSLLRPLPARPDPP